MSIFHSFNGHMNLENGDTEKSPGKKGQGKDD